MLLRRGGEVSRHHWCKLQRSTSASGHVQMKWRLLLPGASEPRLTELNPLGLQNGLSNCVTQPEQPEHSCRLQLLHSPITAEQYREKTRPLRPRRHALFPVLALGAPQGGAASFPTLFSTASGVFGLVAGPSSASRRQVYRVRLFSSLGLMVAPPACEPGKDTFMTVGPRLHHLA